MTQIRPFAYDVVLLLNASAHLRTRLPSIVQSLDGRRMLAATLNHRFYEIHEKNAIKGSLEAHNFDHLMFSMRPGSQRLLAGFTRDDIERFKDLAEVVFAIQVMSRYDIAEGIVAGKFLEVSDRGSVTVGEVEEQIEAFLRELHARFDGSLNVRKQFPWLYSVSERFAGVRDRTLTLVESIPPYAGHDVPLYDDNQISNLEKDIFWVGFDPSFKEVPSGKAYAITPWVARARESTVGKGLFDGKLRYCTRCCLPETMEGISFDELGVCVPCRSSEEKMHINWEEKLAALEALVDGFRSDRYYDCMLPMSGGKDSTFQAHVLREVLDVTPLAVTHGQNWSSIVGRYNLENCLQKFDLDHLIFIMNRDVINRVARKSLGAIGDACWHCHIGAGAFPVQTAVAWNIDLMCFGESIAEADGRGSYQTQKEASVFYFLEVSAKRKAEEMADERTGEADLSPWKYPLQSQLDGRRIRYMHLGDFLFWDEERQVEFLKQNYEWMESSVENAYKGFKSVECVMAGVHDYANFVKRGIGRATIQASADVRRGLLTREEGFELAKQYDTQRPHALDFYLRLTGLTEDEFMRTLVEARATSEYAGKLTGL
jgi:N-acetyl sugar amidotransferase